MKINYNVSAMIANSALQKNDKALSTSLERLSSGLKINHAKDNASGLAMAKRMNAQIKSLEVANQNSNDGVSVIEIAEGALQEVEDMVQRMNELAVKACNGTMSDSDRKNIDEEIKQLKTEIERVAKTTMYNGQVLLDGSFDVKGYSDNIDLKVTTYSDDVRSGEYVIDSINTAYFSDGRLDPESCKIKLGTGFPDGCEAKFYNDKIFIEGPNGFSMEYRLNSRGFDSFAKANELVNPPEFTIMDPRETNGETVVAGLPLDRFYTDPASRPVTPAEYDETTGKYTVKNESGVVLGSYTFDEATGKYDFKDASDNPVGSYEYDKTNNTIKVFDAGGTQTDEYKIEGDKITHTNITAGTTTKYRLDYDQNGKPAADSAYSVKSHIVEHSFSDKKINLDITGLGSMKVQTGSNEGQELGVRIKAISLRTLGINDKDVLTEDNANTFLAQMTDTIKYINSARSSLGAYQNRLEHTISTLDISEENMTGAYSRIMDVDMAEEMTEYTKNNVLVQAGTSMLAQANERPSSVLQLLQG